MSRWMIALGVVLLIVLIAYVLIERPPWGHVEHWKARWIETPDAMYARSAGVFDEPARATLDRSEAAIAGGKATPENHSRAATVLRRNILQQEHRIDSGRPTEADEKESAARVSIYARARDHHARALATMSPANAAAVELLDPGYISIIDDATDFAYTAFADLVANDPLVMARVQDPGVDTLLAQGAESWRTEAVKWRRKLAAEIAPTPAARVATYVELATQHTPDSQNSHDPSVNIAKRSVIDRLRTTQGNLDRLPTLDQISAELTEMGAALSQDPRTGRARPVLVDKAVAVLTRAAAGDWSASTGAGDEEVARRVWARAEEPNNAAALPALRQAYFDALVDSWDRGIATDVIQCVDGRIARMVGSLVLLDHDGANWNMRRLEQHKNDIFARAGKVIRREAAAAAASTDPQLAQVGRAYLAESKAELDAAGDPDPTAETKWIEATRHAIEADVDKYVAASGAIPAHAVAGIKKEATAAI